jgi:hypothetical protein
MENEYKWLLLKGRLNSDGQQFHQYQLNRQLTLTPLRLEMF